MQDAVSGTSGVRESPAVPDLVGAAGPRHYKYITKYITIWEENMRISRGAIPRATLESPVVVYKPKTL